MGFRASQLSGLICVLSLSAQQSGAQEAAELIDLIFEPVPLSVAVASPLEIASSSETDAETLRRAVEMHQAAIEQLAGDRSRGPELVSQLAELAATYQELGLHEEALDALDDAVSRSRNLHGRRGLEQIPLLRQQVRSLRALRDLAAIDDVEEQIYELRERQFDPGSREMYLAIVDLADWLTAAAVWETLDPGSSPKGGISEYLRQMGRCTESGGTPGSGGPMQPICDGRGLRELALYGTLLRGPRTIAGISGPSRLGIVDTLYRNFQLDRIENGDDDLGVTLDLVKRIARLAHARHRDLEFAIDRSAERSQPGVSTEYAAMQREETLVAGEPALQFAVDLLSATAPGPARSRELGAAWLNLGDWRLAFDRTTEAEEAYTQAYRAFEELGLSYAEIDQALAAPLPPRIPVFATQFFTRRGVGIAEDSVLRLRGYVDLSVSVDSAGSVNDLTFLDESAEVPSAVRELLRIDLRSAKFRPTLVGGRLVSPGRIEARYYYSYQISRR